MKAAIAALAVCVILTATGCRGISCTESLPAFSGTAAAAPCSECTSCIDGSCGDICDGGCGCGSPGCLAALRSGLMGCAGGGMCNGRCGLLGGCGGQVSAQLAALAARAERSCANGNCGLPPGPQTGAVNYPYYTTRGPRDFLMCNPPSIGP